MIKMKFDKTKSVAAHWQKRKCKKCSWSSDKCKNKKSINYNKYIDDIYELCYKDN